MGYSHILLQLSPKKPGGHSLKKKIMNNEGCSFSLILVRKKLIPLLFRPPEFVNDLSGVNKLYIDPNRECEWFYL